MKKHLYLLLTLLTLHPTLATQKIITSTIIASTLVLSHASYNKTLSLDLHQAVEQNNTTDALQLINNSQVDINAKVNYRTNWWEEGWTPLMLCAYRGDKWLPIAQALLGHKNINVNLQDNDGWTPLIRCCWKGDDTLQIAQALLGHQHINVNLQNNYGWTPLMMCACTGDDALQIAQALLGHKNINVNLQQEDGCTPLIVCCETGDKSLHIAQALLGHKNINVNLQTKNGCTPLDSIIYWIKQNKENYQYVQLWNLLVAQGGILDKCKADYENLKPSDFNEPQKTYVQAIKNGPVMIISLKLSSLTQENERLTNQLATANQLKDKQKQTLQQQNETIETHLKKISSLQEHSDNLKHTFATFQQTLQQKTRSLKDHTKKTINRLHKSQKDLQKARNELKDKLDTTKQQIQQQNNTIQQLTNQLNTAKQHNTLLNKEITILKRNFNEELSLNLCDAIDEQDYTLAQQLIDNPQVNINIKDENGLTPLLWCCFDGDISLNITTLLLQHPHIQINVKDTYHKNPLHHTCAKGALKTLHLLLNQPTIHQIINQQDHQKNTPLDILFEHITGQHPDTTHVTAWSMLVLQGALLNQHIQNYQQLHPSNFKNPQKAYVHLIKQTPPKKLSSKKHPTLPQNNLNTKFMENEEETKEDE